MEPWVASHSITFRSYPVDSVDCAVSQSRLSIRNERQWWSWLTECLLTFQTPAQKSVAGAEVHHRGGPLLVSDGERLRADPFKYEEANCGG
jgi:hypothetical protein